MKASIAIGIGCRKGCSGEAIAGLVRHALALVPGCSLEDDRIREGLYDLPLGASAASRSALARCDQLLREGAVGCGATLFTSEKKRGEQGVVAAAVALRLPLVFLSQAVLATAAAHCETRSARVQAVIGLPSLAEAAALAGAGCGSRLMLKRISQGGATCAIASMGEGAP
jgi:cobalt-precorrin 5A hydrolase